MILDTSDEKEVKYDEVSITINYNGLESVRKFKFERHEDSIEYIATKLSEVAYEMTDTTAKQVYQDDIKE